MISSEVFCSSDFIINGSKEECYSSIINILKDLSPISDFSDDEKKKEIQFRFQLLLCFIAIKYFSLLCAYENNYFSRGYVYKFIKEIYKKYMSDCFSDFDLCMDPKINNSFDYHDNVTDTSTYKIIQTYEDSNYDSSLDYTIALKIKPATDDSDYKYYFLKLNCTGNYYIKGYNITSRDYLLKNLKNFFIIKEIGSITYGRYKACEENNFNGSHMVEL